MPAFDRHAHWQHVYETKSDHDVSWFQAEPGASLNMIDRCDLPPDARMIDVGGGAARLVDALLDRGFRNVSVLDVADSGLAAAQRRLGDRASLVKWIVADVTQWQSEAHAHRFDLWHDRAAFHFLTNEADCDSYRASLEMALEPGGFAIIATFTPDGPERCSGLPVMRYAPRELAEVLGRSFQLLDSLVDEHRTPGGAMQRFQFSRFQRC